MVGPTCSRMCESAFSGAGIVKKQNQRRKRQIYRSPVIARNGVPFVFPIARILNSTYAIKTEQTLLSVPFNLLQRTKLTCRFSLSELSDLTNNINPEHLCLLRIQFVVNFTMGCACISLIYTLLGFEFTSFGFQLIMR